VAAAGAAAGPAAAVPADSEAAAAAAALLAYHSPFRRSTITVKVRINQMQDTHMHTAHVQCARNRNIYRSKLQKRVLRSQAVL
jgi:hypothetical protein